MSEYPKTIATIGSYIDNRYRLTVHCKEPDCHHSKLADLDALAATYGRDYDLVDNHACIKAAMRCEKCGVKGNVQFNISPPSDIGIGPSLRPEEIDALNRRV